MRRAGGGAPGGATSGRGGRGATRFERSARFWLRAYPRRWRRGRADEVVGVLMELAGAGAERVAADAPERAAVLDRRVGARTAVDLLRHGWATRVRDHPPLHRWLGYRFLDVELPHRYRSWAADDIDGALYMLRVGAIPYAAVLYALVNIAVHRGISFPFVALPLAIALLSLHPAQRRRRRRLARERHLVAQPGEPLAQGAYVAMGEPSRRRPSSWAAPRVVALDLVVIAAGVAATLLAPQALVGMWTPDGLEITAGPPGVLRWIGLGVLTGAGLVSAVRNRRARHALVTHLASLPAQPHRIVEVPDRRHEAWLLAFPGAVLALTVFEVLVTRTAVVVPVLALVAAAHLPRALTLAAAARRAGRVAPDGSPLAWRDLMVIAATHRPPTPDQPQRVVRRWDGPTVPGQAVLGPRVYTGEDRERGDPFRLA